MLIKLCLMLTFLCICGFFVYSSITTRNESLKLAHVLFRHGERSPTKTYKYDPHKDYKWPGGWDQLTTRGKLEEYKLGKSLRTRYHGYLPKIYHQNDILVQSSYADRCIMSAQLLLAALYPPHEDQIWNKDLLWQPIPIHSIPRHLDNKIAIKQACKKYSSLLESVNNTTRIKNAIDSNQQLFSYLSEHTGDNISTLRELETIFNTLEIEELNGLSLPGWVKDVYPKKMLPLALLSLELYSETETMKRLHGGALVKEMLLQMELKAAGKLNPDRKMFLYSGHDLTLVTLLRVLGFDSLEKPKFGSSVMVELHSIENENIVKFYYQSAPEDDCVEIFLKRCGMKCTLDELRILLEPVLPIDWQLECDQ